MSRYELKTWALGSNEVLGVQDNTLEITVANPIGRVGLVYTLDMLG